MIEPAQTPGFHAIHSSLQHIMNPSLTARLQSVCHFCTRHYSYDHDFVPSSLAEITTTKVKLPWPCYRRRSRPAINATKPAEAPPAVRWCEPLTNTSNGLPPTAGGSADVGCGAMVDCRARVVSGGAAVVGASDWTKDGTSVVETSVANVSV